MGSRAVVVVCRDRDVARTHFGVIEDEAGIIYTRTGRRFFDDAKLEAALLSRVRAGIDRAGLWEDLSTDWLCLDCELMPWSAKAQALVRSQYASVGGAATAALAATLPVIEQAAARGAEVSGLLERTREQSLLARRFVDGIPTLLLARRVHRESSGRTLPRSRERGLGPRR